MKRRARPSSPAAHPRSEDLTEEDVVADGSYSLQMPPWRNVARMEEERVADDRLLQVLVDDFCDRDSRLPLPAGVGDVWQRMSVNEGELPALEEHAAISRRETATAAGAVRDYLPDCELSLQRFALGFVIDAGCEAF